MVDVADKLSVVFRREHCLMAVRETCGALMSSLKKQPIPEAIYNSLVCTMRQTSEMSTAKASQPYRTGKMFDCLVEQSLSLN